MADGAATWAEDQAELADPDMWTSMWGSVSSAASKAYNITEDYAGEVYENVSADIDEAYEALKADPIEAIRAANNKLIEAGEELIDDAIELGEEALEIIGESAELANSLIKHRDAILALPDLITSGERSKIEYFVDTVLMEIAPDMANDLKDSDNYYIVLEVIAEHDTALIYSSYLTLTLDAIPPTFTHSLLDAMACILG